MMGQAPGQSQTASYLAWRVRPSVVELVQLGGPWDGACCHLKKSCVHEISLSIDIVLCASIAVVTRLSLQI